MNTDTFLQELGPDALRQMENDINAGVLQQKIRGRLASLQERGSKACAVCGGLVEEGFSLEFGPKDLRKRAHFCARDCLDYFLAFLQGGMDEDAYY